MLDNDPFIFLQQCHRSTIPGPPDRLAFILAVAMSRGLSILTYWLVERYIGLKVIEYDNQQELRVMRRFIGALSGALVEIQDASGSWVSSENAQWQECINYYP